MRESDSAPRLSIMQMKMLEEEAMRHFPLMDAKARATYVFNCIEQTNQPVTAKTSENDQKEP